MISYVLLVPSRKVLVLFLKSPACLLVCFHLFPISLSFSSLVSELVFHLLVFQLAFRPTCLRFVPAVFPFVSRCFSGTVPGTWEPCLPFAFFSQLVRLCFSLVSHFHTCLPVLFDLFPASLSSSPLSPACLATLSLGF